MVETGVIILNILINTLPEVFLRYLIFMDRLRVKKHIFLLIYFALFSVQAAFFIFWQKNENLSFEAVQLFKTVSSIVFFLIPFFIIRIDFFANLHMYFLGACYLLVIIRISNFINLYFSAVVFDFTNNNLLIVTMLTITIPFVCLFYQGTIKPAFHAVPISAWKLQTFVPATFFAFNVATSAMFGYEPFQNKIFFAYIFLLTGGTILSFFLFSKILKESSETEIINANAKMIEQQLSIQSEQYDLLSQYISEARKTRHDVRHHIAVMQLHIENNEIENLKNYIFDYGESLPHETFVPLCENFTASTIVSHYINMAKESDVQLYAKLQIPKNLNVSDTDLCVILGNLLENAIEGCQHVKTGTRFVKIRSKVFENMLTIVVDNTFSGEIKKIGDKFISNKRDGHGIGTTSVSAIVKKHNGKIKFEVKDNIFQVSVLLQNINRRI